MRTATRTIYYCDHCNKHGMRKDAMIKHERYCTLNPDRICRWSLLDYTTMRAPEGPHRGRRGLPRWLRLIGSLDEDTLSRFREYANGCPACMLAAVRQSGLNHQQLYHYSGGWDYDREIKRYREEEKDYWQMEERRAIEATFL